MALKVTLLALAALGLATPLAVHEARIGTSLNTIRSAAPEAAVNIPLSPLQTP